MDYEDKRAQNTALAGMLLQVALGGLFCAVWLLTGSRAAGSILWLHAGGILIWGISAVVFHCRRMAELEQRELEELAAQRDGIFDKTAELRLAGRRLEIVLRWLMPLTALAVAAGYLAWGILELSSLLRQSTRAAESSGELSWAFFCLGGAFLGFLFSRYALGMARDDRWRLLRAGGSMLSVATLAAALQCAAFFLGHLEIAWGQSLLPYVAAAAMAVIGIEILLNLILDFYRPRKPGEIPRPAFDSRLASLLSEPGSIAHSIAEAINYQFGFEVSGTWFYQLLRKTLAPLLLFGIVALFAVSMIVVVPTGSKALIFSWGRYSKLLDEGAHVKAPWPIQSADLVAVENVRTMVIGESGQEHHERHARAGETLMTDLFLWSEDHGDAEEINLLTASSSPLTPSAGETPNASERYSAFSLLRVVLNIHYRVVDPVAYRLSVKDPEAVLRDIAMQKLTSYLARRDIDQLLSSEGIAMAPQLATDITQSTDALTLGIEIVDLSVRGIHPPSDVADAFHESLTAEQERIGMELAARTSAETQLGNTAGSMELARKISEAAAKLHELRSGGGEDEHLQQAVAKADALLEQAGGEVKMIINAARAERWEQEVGERTRWLVAENQKEAYQAAPKLFLLDEKLRVLRDALADQRKYVLGLDPDKLEIRYSDDRRTTGAGFDLQAD